MEQGEFLARSALVQSLCHVAILYKLLAYICQWLIHEFWGKGNQNFMLMCRVCLGGSPLILRHNMHEAHVWHEFGHARVQNDERTLAQPARETHRLRVVAAEYGTKHRTLNSATVYY